METRQLIYHLMHNAFVDLQAEGKQAQNKVVFWLARLCVSAPLELEQVTSGMLASDVALTHLREQAAATYTRQGLEYWIGEGYDQWKERILEYQPQTAQAVFADESSARVFKVLYSVLIEIRVQGHEIQNNRIWGLADLFHNVPLALNHAYQVEGNYDELLAEIQQRAEGNGCAVWLQQATDSIVHITDTTSH
jgi:hypothetical protein